MDPLIGVGTILTAREFALYLLPGLIVLAVALICGRIFCGHICPLGTTLDIGQSPITGKRRLSSKTNSYEATTRYRTWKYAGLVVILAAAVGGVSLLFVGSPLSLVTRFYGIMLYPLLLLLADSGIQIAAPVLTAFPAFAYIQIPQKVFATNLFIVSLFAGIIALAYVQPRFWCRNLCPAGALLGLFSRKPLVKRTVNESCTQCGLCVRKCPTAAISEDPSKTVHSECIVCLRCVEKCPVSAISFSAVASKPQPAVQGPDLTRRAIVLSVGSGFLTAGLFRTGLAQSRPHGREKTMSPEDLIRPPGALPEPEFLARCVRCGECMKACATNTLQPVWLKAGIEGLFSPVMVPRLAACAINCTVCGHVCPTGAIRELPLIEKQHAKVGTASVDRRSCLAWEQDKKCLVCDECCPYNAVTFKPVPDRRNGVPFVEANKCTGCGWCETKCPVEGTSAIRVNILGEMRLASGSYVEKAREYGLVFRASDNKGDRLAPGTFSTPQEGAGAESSTEAPKSPPSGLPPGFIEK
jgi:MauM/NapG family ferredoxin protein